MCQFASFEKVTTITCVFYENRRLKLGLRGHFFLKFFIILLQLFCRENEIERRKTKLNDGKIRSLFFFQTSLQNLPENHREKATPPKVLLKLFSSYFQTVRIRW